MALLQNVIQRGTHASRPAAGSAGVVFFESDTCQLFRDSGSAWQLIDLSSLFATKGDLLVGTGSGTVAKLAVGTDTYILTADSAQTDGIKWAAAAAGGLETAYLCYQDQKTQNTASGGFTSGAWRTRTLNTEVADTGNHGTLASNQVTLDAGTYRCLATAPAQYVNKHQARLQNITDSATLLVGTSSYCTNQTDGNQTLSLVTGNFTIAAAKVIELQHQCSLTNGTNGFGIACNFTTEIFATLELWKQ